MTNLWLQLERLFDWVLRLILRFDVIFWSCVAANLLGALIGGVFWYGPMLLASPLWAWPFIPDCPLAALYGTIALLGIRYTRRWDWFYAFTSFGCIKYGIWTVVFWAYKWLGTGDIQPYEVLLFVTHIGLICEGLVFIPRIGPLSLGARLAVIAWFALSIFVDYGLGFHPPLVSPVTEPLVFWLATGLTAALGAGLLALPRPGITTNAPTIVRPAA